MDPIHLRPHHGLCIPNFVGRGYDEAFTQNMTALIAHLTAHPAQKVVLWKGEDVLCGSCPHNQGGCVTLEKVLRLDQDLLEACGLQKGREISWGDFQALVEEKVFQTPAFDRICGDCSWYELCKSRQSAAGRTGKP